MTILFDLSAAQPIIGSDFHGAAEYAKTVFYKLFETLSETTNLEIFYNPEKNIDNDLVNKCQNNNVPINLCKTNSEISALLIKKQYDLFFTALPYSYYNLNIPKNTKFVYTVHGLRSTEYPWDDYILKYKKQNFRTHVKYVVSLFLFHWWIEYLKRKSTKNFNLLFNRTKNQTIITVSCHSKYSINYFSPHIAVSAIETLYSPPKLIQSPQDEGTSTLKDFSLEPGKYILLIGGDREEKGAYRACRALVKLFSQEKHSVLSDVKVLILGVSYEKAYRKLIKNSSHFVLAAYVPSQTLEMLYKYSLLFIYPTMNEGFGYPPLEAMKYGTLCACSANSSITEICADSVLYFNPHNEDEISIRVLQSFDSEIRKEKTEKMKARLEQVRLRQERDLDRLAKIISGNP
ncbi:glycosyltransferase, family 1 [Treponema primitia ZAS-2]|uniref:Glycosyltransferase, family 1 n=1 Tax=Treponema primitia (strain ATCC BAA-887 / DSM 12427 / ZAS-2) TaxID=545694 RepID=F5YHI6_TREPZ|nr:glycosyltransferase [Treponema primitia]AEF84916.1 glycosyltransferase, family 1 [Treponema primitia ZAS-2]